ncbi:MAG: heparinase II/III family protein [Oligoflexales bacterium]
MTSETYTFFRWTFTRNNIFNTIIFLFNKIRVRYLAPSYGLNYYPVRLKRLLNLDSFDQKNRWTLSFSSFDPTTKPANGVQKIRLASKWLECGNKSIYWHSKFPDSEDEESLHRWNWLLSIDLSNSIEKKQTLKWVNQNLESWIELFHIEHQEILKNQKLKAKWQSYTIGERISNSILFYYSQKTKPTDKIFSALKDQTKLLTARVEFFGKSTGNHVLNNARAIFLAGTSFGVPEWINFAKEIIYYILPKLMDCSGFLREGSSHYQLLFTRWLVEIYHFSKIAKDNNFCSYLAPRCTSALKACKFFMIKNEYGYSIPLFGDISPDFTPQFLFPMITGKSNENRFLSDLWHQECMSFKIQDYQNTYPDSGWYQIDAYKQKVFTRLEKSGIPQSVGHHHYDILHFCLFYKGLPVLVDSGRSNYMPNNEFGCFGKQAEAHNTLLIDNLPIIPNSHHRLPRQYCSSDCTIDLINNKNDVKNTIKITTNGFERLKKPINLTRTIQVKSDGSTVTDNLIGKGNHLLASYFHWAPEIKMSQIDCRTWLGESKNIKFIFSVTSNSIPSITHYFGGQNHLGWVSTEYGAKKPAETFKIQFQISLPDALMYTITWLDL